MPTKKFVFAALLLFYIFLITCTEEYRPEIERYEKVLVVDGMITNAEPPYIVHLSLSSSVYEPDFTPYSGAKITISDDKGNAETLEEIEDGIYQTSKNGMQGECGRSYKIIIETNSGKTYESDYEMLQESVAIDSVYAEVEQHENATGDETYQGVQFYVDSKTSDSDTAHLLWKCEETYRFKSDFHINYKYENYRMYSCHNPDSVYYCYATNRVNDIACIKTTSNKTQAIQRMPLNYISTATKRLTIRYSLLVRQLTISPKAWFYWSAIDKQNEEQGAFYSKQPYQIRSNVRNNNDSNEPVLGYFLVAGESKKRIFVNRPNGLLFTFDRCVLETEYGLYLWLSPRAMWPIYLAETSEGIGVADKRCFDCTLVGGDLQKPDFWVDNSIRKSDSKL